MRRSKPSPWDPPPHQSRHLDSIIEHTNGIKEHDRWNITQAEVAVVLGCTRQWVQQIEERAIRKLWRQRVLALREDDS